MEISSSSSGDGDDNGVNLIHSKDNIMPAGDSQEFAEYVWMANPEEEDQVYEQVMEEYLEEQFIEDEFEDMLEEEALGLFSPPEATSNGSHVIDDNGTIVTDPEGGVQGGHDRHLVESGQTETGSAFGVNTSDEDIDSTDSESTGDDVPQR